VTRESNPNPMHALVVDDEFGVRCLVVKALKKEGFICDVAETVDEALEYISTAQYQLVVTDLAMPNRNGHSFAVELLGLRERPTVIVLTGVLEPRLAKDLIARGVDDVVFKPVQMSMFAAKARSLTERRLRARLDAASPSVPGSGTMGLLPRLSQEEVDARLRGMSRMPPVSKAALDIYKMTAEGDISSQQLAAAVQLEPALIAEVLRLANSSFFNPTVQKINGVEQAVVRLGQKRVGELALTLATFSAIAQEAVPFFSLASFWRKCLAAGICIELLLENSPTVGPKAGLFSAAILQPMGRLLLASVFPEYYEHMLQLCEDERKSLSELEGCLFPQTAGEIAATALAAWGIPDTIHRPLRYTSLPFRAISTINDPLRGRVELLKTASFLGVLGAAHFDRWELIDIPPAGTLGRLGIQSIDYIVKQCREDLQQLASFGLNGAQVESKVPGGTTPSMASSVAYQCVRSEPIDFVPYILEISGRRVENCPDEISDEKLIVVNALDVAAQQALRCLRNPRNNDTLILTDGENADRLRNHGCVIVLPCAYLEFADAVSSSVTNSFPSTALTSPATEIETVGNNTCA
jgi:HD-like signal output (HDOD) protein/FixJ family two-component response regulator